MILINSGEEWKRMLRNTYFWSNPSCGLVGELMSISDRVKGIYFEEDKWHAVLFSKEFLEREIKKKDDELAEVRAEVNRVNEYLGLDPKET